MAGPRPIEPVEAQERTKPTPGEPIDPGLGPPAKAARCPPFPFPGFVCLAPR